MGRSSCLKLIACGTAADDDLPLTTTATATATAQTKPPAGSKRGWSFGNKSRRHQLISNNNNNVAVADADADADMKPQQTPNSADIVAQQYYADKPQPEPLPLVVSPGNNATPHPSTNLGILIQSLVSQPQLSKGLDSTVDHPHPVAIILQTSIRAFLARQRFLQLKNVVTLQAFIRGHLVRRDAVETLHCIRGITKVQALVRAQSSKSLDQNFIKSEGKFSTAKLLKNSFALQLMESTPKAKYVSVRCDPFSPNSAWAWLERWMSVTSAELEKVNQAESHHPEADVEPSSRSLPDSFVSEFVVDEINKESSEGNRVVYLVDSQSSLLSFVEKQPPLDQMSEGINESVNTVKVEAHVSVTSVLPAEPASLPDEAAAEASLPDEAAAEIQQSKLCAKQLASEELNVEGKKQSCGSRKASHLEVGADTSPSPSPEETCIKTSEPSVLGVDSVPRALVAGSECGTELSVTSTLDSPDRYELENAQPEPQVKILEAPADCETNPVCDISSETTHQGEARPQLEQISEIKASDELMNITSVGSGIIDENEHKENTSDQNALLEHLTALPAEKSSPVTSSRSITTVAESYGTPSSQVSVKDKRSKMGKSGSNTKGSSLSAGKRPPSNPNLESCSRSSGEHLVKNHRSGKRRNSFGSTKSDADQEPRDSNSHNSVPSYMQATKSAKAKAHSPRSSPDLHDKEVNSKKRTSLPATGGRQGSPRVQRSPSEAAAAQGAKANGSHPPNERKWQR